MFFNNRCRKCIDFEIEGIFYRLSDVRWRLEWVELVAVGVIMDHSHSLL